jgi:hypothetical protein
MPTTRKSVHVLTSDSFYTMCPHWKCCFVERIRFLFIKER